MKTLAILFLSKACSVHVVQGPVEAASTVHVLAVLPLDDDVDVTDVVALDLLVLGAVEAVESHELHHVQLLGGLAGEVLGSERGLEGLGGLLLFLSFPQLFTFTIPCHFARHFVIAARG